MRRFFRGRDASSDSSPPTPSFSPSPSSRSSAPVTGPPRPIRLVYCDDNGKFRMDQEAVSMLQLVKEPIGIVAVCGRARQGKSFILNQETYSTQIFSLAVLLSSMFIYNQMGGIDEGSLDRISLVTQMTKHIRVKASGGTTASEIGQFSPIFVWLLRDFYLDLSEDSGRITPRDYLELALKPVDDRKRDVVAKNEIRASIRALFPDRECFTLVRPLNNEHDLQRLDEIQLDKLRPEFRSGLDALTRFVFERTRPKQVGATMMTGPVLVGITQSYLDALNKGAVPTISSSWQSVEEDGCRTAYDYALEVYKSAFHRPKDPEEAAFREAHEKAVQKSLAAFNDGAVGVGSARKKYEAELHKKLKKEFENAMEAELQCSNSIQSMERKLRIACHASDANIDNVLKVLDGLLPTMKQQVTVQQNGRN
ncbi:guanylate-binding protein 4 [Prunus yedoensis var. nudiflora]|uniref:Guanylate-binding protein 4 n=1 Tax=Prunus yedoensis var. nudiflora TaxID=2094558 RepID=A0A314ZII0_PRUYE|nr:guanylate-binding protein 4 [Prunus yedoensis var. nudiflora]